MKFNLKNLVVVNMSALLLSACFEVEDNSNDELTAALLEQNRILEEQANALTENEVTISAVFVDDLSDVVLSAGTVTVRSATQTYTEDQALVDGKFVLEGVPTNTDLEISVSSENYLSRVFYLNSGSANNSNTETFLGRFSVSEPVDIIIAVLNGVTNMPVTGLEFTADSSFGTGLTEDEFLHRSTFNEVDGQYEITVPKDITTIISASIDADRDGVPDLSPEDSTFLSGTNLSLVSSQVDGLVSILVFEDEIVLTEPVQFRISIVDDAGAPLTSAMINVDDEFNQLMASYDETSQQYVLDTNFLNNIDFDIPAFTENGTSFESASISVFDTDDGLFSIFMDNVSSNRSFLIEQSMVVNIAMQPQQQSNGTPSLEIIQFNDPEESADNSFSMFFSSPVTVADASVTLTDFDFISVVIGNDSDTDTVLDGTTLIIIGQSVPVDIEMSLNNTRLTVTPSQSLTPFADHRYDISTVRVTSSDTDINIDVSTFFETSFSVSNVAFDINELVADNYNATTNGDAIVGANSAGAEALPSNLSGSVRIILPDSIYQLQTLNLTLTNVVENGVSSPEFEAYSLVQNGSLNRLFRRYFLRVADNETIFSSGSVGLIETGANQETGYKFTFGNSIAFLSDNIEGVDENSMTFDYAYETKAGEVFTGTITLPVE